MGRWSGWPSWAKWGGEDSGPPTYSITGTINDADGNGLDGVTVTLTGDASDSTTTSGGGAYEFTGLSAGSYTVTPTKAGLTFNPTSAAVTITTADKTATTMASVWAITGTINDSAGAGLSGVTVTLSGDASATDTTDGSGAYSFGNLANGSYTVTPTKAGSTFSPASDNVTVNGADKVATTMAQVWEITGTINDSAGAGLSGVTVTLTGDASDSTTTAGDGTYSFSGLSDGSYTVTPTKSGSTFSPTSDAVAISGSDAAADTMAQVWEISGSIVDGDTAGIEGVLVTLSGDASDTDTTDSNGDYNFPGLSDGSYTVTPTKDTYTFTPTSRSPSVSGADVAVDNMVGSAFSWPQVVNMEGIALDTTDLSSYTSAYSPTSGTRAVKVDDHADLDAIGNGRSYSRVWYSSPTAWESGGWAMYFPTGNGFTPSDGETVRCECLVSMEGTASRVRLYLQSADGQDGIYLESTIANKKALIYTATGGSWTQKVEEIGFWSSQPFGYGQWAAFGFEYNFSTNAYIIRGVGCEAGYTENNTASGTLSSPTFDADTELNKLTVSIQKQFYNGGDAVGCAQLWCSNDDNALPLGYAGTRNFEP